MNERNTANCVAYAIYLVILQTYINWKIFFKELSGKLIKFFMQLIKNAEKFEICRFI